MAVEIFTQAPEAQLRAIERNFAKLERDRDFNFAKRIIQKEMREFAAPMIEDMRSRVPVDTGALKRTIRPRGSSEGTQIGISAGIKSRGRGKVLAIEAGTKHQDAHRLVKDSFLKHLPYLQGRGTTRLFRRLSVALAKALRTVEGRR